MNYYNYNNNHNFLKKKKEKKQKEDAFNAVINKESTNELRNEISYMDNKTKDEFMSYLEMKKYRGFNLEEFLNRLNETNMKNLVKRRKSVEKFGKRNTNNGIEVVVPELENRMCYDGRCEALNEVTPLPNDAVSGITQKQNDNEARRRAMAWITAMAVRRKNNVKQEKIHQPNNIVEDIGKYMKKIYLEENKSNIHSILKDYGIDDRTQQQDIWNEFVEYMDDDGYLVYLTEAMSCWKNEIKQCRLSEEDKVFIIENLIKFLKSKGYKNKRGGKKTKKKKSRKRNISTKNKNKL